MIAPRKILVPTDFSAGSRAALDYAVMLHRELGAKVELLHAWQPFGFRGELAYVPIPGESPITLDDYARRTAGKEMQDWIESLRVRGVTGVHGRIESGNAAEHIVAAAADGFDLVVMGTHGRTGIARLFMGSVAERVVRLASCPVLTIRVADEAAELTLVPLAPLTSPPFP